jgi:DUF971 family protein
MNQNVVWPEEIRLKKGRQTLLLTFTDKSQAEFSAEFLRVLSPSAEVQGHSAEQRVTVPGKKNVKIKSIEPVGTYAVRLVFDDGHSSGYYSWKYFKTLADEKDSKWQAYLNELSEKGLGRE